MTVDSATTLQQRMTPLNSCPRAGCLVLDGFYQMHYVPRPVEIATVVPMLLTTPALNLYQGESEIRSCASWLCHLPCSCGRASAEKCSLAVGQLPLLRSSPTRAVRSATAASAIHLHIQSAWSRNSLTNESETPAQVAQHLSKAGSCSST